MSYIKAIANGLSVNISVRTVSDVVYKMRDNKYLKITVGALAEPIHIIAFDPNDFSSNDFETT